MKPFFNLRQDFLWVFPNIGVGFGDDKWISISWLGMEVGIAFSEEDLQ